MDEKTLIAKRVSLELKPDTLVNLGIGLPTLVSQFVPPGMTIFFQSENGVVGMGARPPEGMEDLNLIDAGGGFVTAVPGAAAHGGRDRGSVRRACPRRARAVLPL